MLKLSTLKKGCVALSIVTLAFNASAQNKENRRPNIVLIMADDMGYSDIGCYGGEIKTPNIDNLAKNGLRFSQFYNTSRCCPTRASLLTGLYSHQAGIGDMTFDQKQPGYRGYLTENTVTIAEVLKKAGYQTGMVGKWHVSNTFLGQKDEHLKWLNHQSYKPFFSPVEQYPVNRGFEKYYGTIWGVNDYFDPFSLVNGTEPVKTVPKDFYYTDAINDTASAYIKQFSKTGKPFFLYVANTAPHWPLHALPEDIKKYEDTYKAGWDAIREARYKKLIAEGVFPADKNILSKRWKPNRKWEDNPTKDWDAHTMAVRAAMIDRMDQGIGRIIKTLKETGQLDNTLIIFLSDNGASSDDAQKYLPGNDRPGETRTGQKIIYPANKDVNAGPETTFASADEMWSNVANVPFRYWKTEPFEGGICTPMIAYWPAGLKTPKGSVTTQMGHVMDFMATFAELAGTTYPTEFEGRKITPTSGISLVPILKGKKRQGHDYLFFEHIGRRAVIHGDWKLLALNNAPWELYNLKEDRSEMHDLITEHPDIAENLTKAWQEWANSHNVLPKPVKAEANKQPADMSND
ncbi:arylsulfatase [Mucilaginibacter mali]|uniref:Arylsulfatase n=1 Tax=Mucilaginibacter mali TaxID=2740462 RepID=A0A7D4UKL3_9SPHI|nr:arylsulfatase [Mucilaginibacter mali]QKJ28561.1 arylsulfatase [Mucilaginibacter mali]